MEIKPNTKKRFNQSIWGLLFGLLLPSILFMGVFIYFYISSDNPEFNLNFFYHDLTDKKILIPITTVCVLPNLLLYVIFKKLDYWYAIKGLVASILVFVIIVLIFKFM